MLSALQSFERLPGRPTLGQPIQPDPTLPLWRLTWEDERTDLPGVGTVHYTTDREADGTLTAVRTIVCHCGLRFTAASPHPVAAEDGVFAQLLAHARMALLATA